MMHYSKKALHDLLKIQYGHISECRNEAERKAQSAYTQGLLDMFRMVYPEDPDGLTYHEREALRTTAIE